MRTGLPIAVFFGLLEGMAFLCLFLTLILNSVGASEIWGLIASMRVLVLGLALQVHLSILSVRAGRARWREALRFLGEASLYQIPFWVSALVFPFGSQQALFAFQGLLLQTCGLLGLASLLLVTGLGAEAIVFGVSWLWAGPRWPDYGAFLLALTGLLVAWVFPKWKNRWGRRLTYGQVIALGFAWLAIFGLNPVLSLNLGDSLEPVIYWVLLLWVSVVAKNVQEAAAINSEAEGSLPSVRDGRFWLGGRQVLYASIGWLALMTLILKEPRQIGVVLALGMGGFRALELASRGWFTAERWAWWSAMELTLLWAIDRSELPFYPGWLSVSLLGCLWAWVRRGSGSPTLHGTSAFAALENRLRHCLLISAPPGFAQKLAGGVEVDLEFEQDLTAAVPTGFRDRLLQRLRQSEKEEGLD